MAWEAAGSYPLPLVTATGRDPRGNRRQFRIPSDRLLTPDHRNSPGFEQQVETIGDRRPCGAEPSAHPDDLFKAIRDVLAIPFIKEALPAFDTSCHDVVERAGCICPGLPRHGILPL